MEEPRTPQYARDPSSITAILSELQNEGYTGDFAAREGAMLLCLTCRQMSPAADVRLDCTRRMEGASDPSDMLAIAALVCPQCQARGTAVLGYGPDSSPEDADVLSRLEDGS